MAQLFIDVACSIKGSRLRTEPYSKGASDTRKTQSKFGAHLYQTSSLHRRSGPDIRDSQYGIVHDRA